MSLFSQLNKILSETPKNPENYFEPYDNEKLEDFKYKNDVLQFNIIRYTYKPKIERYVQKDYERTPIYSSFPSISTKKVFTFNKVIQIQYFCETQIRALNIDVEFKKNDLWSFKLLS